MQQARLSCQRKRFYGRHVGLFANAATSFRSYIDAKASSRMLVKIIDTNILVAMVNSMEYWIEYWEKNQRGSFIFFEK